jgi:hypothetical protein
MMLVVVASHAFSQSKGQTLIGANLILGLPTGHIGEISNTGFGFGAELKGFVSDRIALGAELSMVTFPVKDEFIDDITGGMSGDISESHQFTSILADFNIFLANQGFRPYLGAATGLYLWKVKATAGGMSVSSESYKKLGIGPELGFLAPLSSKLELKMLGRYNVVFDESGNATYISIQAGLLYHL